MDFSNKACLHVISNSVSIPNRTECLSDLIQTATSSEFCPSVTRLLVQDNIKTKNKRQNQLETFFFNFLSFSLLSFEQQAICFQTDLKLNLNFHHHQLPSEMGYHTQKQAELLWDIHSTLSLFLYSPIFSPPFPMLFLLSHDFGVKELPTTNIRELGNSQESKISPDVDCFMEGKRQGIYIKLKQSFI